MYLYQPCLLTMALYAWAFDRGTEERRWLRVLTPLAILALSEWELTFAGARMYPSAWLLTLSFLLEKGRSISWAEVLTASLLGGLICWKAADAWPLLWGILPLCGALLLGPILLLCKGREDRLFACALGGMVFELCFCLREYMLFSYCVIRLGSRDGLSLGTVGICVYEVAEQVRWGVLSRIKRTKLVRN